MIMFEVFIFLKIICPYFNFFLNKCFTVYIQTMCENKAQK